MLNNVEVTLKWPWPKLDGYLLGCSLPFKPNYGTQFVKVSEMSVMKSSVGHYDKHNYAFVENSIYPQETTVDGCCNPSTHVVADESYENDLGRYLNIIL